jgi:type IV pilus assembly protein PilW
MVALAIGSFAAIIMLQVFAMSEERKRTTTSGGDAQSNGIIAYYQLQRDIGQAGYGFSATGVFGCNLVWPVASGNIATPVPLAPVTINPATSIIPAGDANTDTLLVVYGNTSGQPQGNRIVAQSGATSTVQMPTSFAIGDRVIAAPSSTAASPPAPCTSNLLIDQITAVTAMNVTVATGAAGGTLYNLGPGPSALAYAVRGGNLTVCDYMANDCGLPANAGNPAIWVPIAENIVSMKAVYWRDTSAPMDSIPDANGHDQLVPTTGCGWARISAVNLVLVARSGQYSKEVVTTAAPTWSENTPAPILGAGAIGPNTAADEPWKHYRYKTFEAVIPMRNIGWLGVPAECL